MRTNRPYVQIDPDVLERVRQIDLLSYLREFEPSNLVKVKGTSNVYCTAEHDSLKISNGKWYWWSRGFGGYSALDYLIKDLSGYDFTDNYVESRLQDVFDNGAIYLLPSTYNCYGITYNKTLLKKYGWELPNSFAELEALAAEAKEAGVDLCLPQIQYPGYGFQYLCNIADADFLGTLDGKLWQKDYLSGEANVSNTPGMMQAMAYVQKWKDIGMLNDSGDALDDNVTRQRMTEGNTLFLIGGTNGIVESDDNADKFGLMPYLSEDGTQNVFVLKVNRFYGLNKKLEQNPQKLEDALKVMRVLSTVEGSSALIPAKTLKCSLLPFKDAKADDTYYADVADVLNAGNTAP